jgi:Ni,Fe-hydrogenase III large subunit
MNAFDIIRAAGAEPCRPWPRHVLAPPDWAAMVAALAHDSTVLLGLWADSIQVHALLRRGHDIQAASVPVEAGRYPALSPARPAAALCERMIGDLWGHEAAGGLDTRHWLDHGRWPLAHPLSPRPGLPGGAVEPPEFITVDAPGVMQIPLGPVHGAIGEPAHLRVSVRAETVLHAEARLGYAHKGTLALMRGKSARTAARFVARLAAEATVAHSLAFARATEAALEVEVPPRATVLRMVMAEHERMAGHLDDLARLADAAGCAALHAVAGRQRELLLRAAEQAFGHRLMMDLLVPGGMAADIAPDGAAAIRAALDGLAAALPGLWRRMEPLLARLEGVGVIAPVDLGGVDVEGPDVGGADVADVDPGGVGAGGVGAGGVGGGGVGVGGVVGRAAGRGFDVRVLDAAYAEFGLTAATEHVGDAAARCRVRLAEVADSARLLRTFLSALPEGPVSVALPAASGEGIGCAESLRGAVWHWLRLDHGQIAAAFPCDPGWALWPLAEAAISAGPMEDVDLIRLSCSLPVSVLDL